MKKICLILVAIFLLVSLCGCVTKQKNSFVEGKYTNEEYKLIVTAIDEETFKSRNGINVVEDKSVNRKNQYYEVVLYKIGNEHEGDIELTFTNLTLTTVTSAEPCYYTDENGNSICPQSSVYIFQYDIKFNEKKIEIKGVCKLLVHINL